MGNGEAAPAVRYPRIAEVVAGDLRRQIVTGELEEGQTLPREAELIARYGVISIQVLIISGVAMSSNSG
jgi:DNA-binding GntR family transcriptional regulator